MIITKASVLIVILLTLMTVLPYFRGDFFYTQDHIFVARLYQMHKALIDTQFPVRWSPDLRFGEPTFNFYAPLPYYLGAIFKIIGSDFISSLKLLFILSSVLSGLTMYLFLKKLFNNLAGVTGAVLYVFAPYRAVDLYVRGALSEVWAFIFFPLIFLTSLNLSENKSTKNVIFLALSLAGLFLTHNVMTVMFVPFFFLWVFFLIWRQGIRASLFFGTAFLLGIALSASYLLPAFFERSFIQSQYLTTGYFDFRAHFVAISQFFSLFWGYGSSLWGIQDDLSFQIGLVNLGVIALSAIFVFINRLKKKMVVLFSLLIFSLVFSLFMQHNKSAFIWETIPLLAFIQFPWRFLGLSIFFIAILGGLLVYLVKGKWVALGIFIIVTSILLNFNYFKPNKFISNDFFNKFLDEKSMQKGIELTKDYVPIWVKLYSEESIGGPILENGKVWDFTKNTRSQQFKVTADEEIVVTVPVTYFPGWEVNSDGRLISQNEPSVLGLINFNLPAGEHLIKLEFKDTFIRKVGNWVSLFSIFVVALSLIKDRFYAKKP